jgi:hypothetical protein
MCPSLRVIVNEAGAARRPSHRARTLWLVVGCTVAYVIGYVVIKHTLGGK